MDRLASEASDPTSQESWTTAIEAVINLALALKAGHR
jgi:hypothetical protein